MSDFSDLVIRGLEVTATLELLQNLLDNGHSVEFRRTTRGFYESKLDVGRSDWQMWSNPIFDIKQAVLEMNKHAMQQTEDK